MTQTISRKSQDIQKYISEYESGKSINSISEKYNIDANELRNLLKSYTKFYKNSINNLNEDDKNNIVNLYKNETSVLEISDKYQIPCPSIIKFLLYQDDIKRIYHKGRKFDILKQTPFTKIQQEFIVGTLLGDGCIRKSGKLPRLCLVHSKKFENYFHWKISQMENYFNLWREQIHKKKNSTLLYTETLQHAGLNKFYEMFYNNSKKIIPKNLDLWMTPYSLAVWFLDDGTLNSKTNHRIYTNCFTYEEQLELKSLLKRCFDLDCKIIQRKDLQYYLSFNSKNTIKLSKIIEPYVIPSMKYKLRMSLDCSSTTTCQTPEKDDDIV